MVIMTARAARARIRIIFSCLKLSRVQFLFAQVTERIYYYYYKMNTTLNLFKKEQTNQLRKFGEQIPEEMGIPPSPLKEKRDN